MKKLGVLLLALQSSVLVAAELKLDNSESALNFVSTKNAQVAEVLCFDNLQGSVDTSTGKANIGIDLSSVNTGIDIRDERMRTYLFDTANNSQATFTATVDMATLQDLKAGEQSVVKLEGELNLAGQSNSVAIDADVTRLTGGGYQVATRAPVILKVDAFGLTPGVAKLQELAGLNSISVAVPVTFSVVFR